MRNYKKYRSTVINLFQSFLAGKIDKKEMLYGLYDIEVELIKGKKTDKGMWFKFSKDDTGSSTINDMYEDIDSRINNLYIRERMQIAIDNPKELQIYFS